MRRLLGPEPMQDVQRWVTSEASQVLFLYGEFDPWSGGAYDIGTQADVVKVVAPKAPHGAMITDLNPADRDLALRTIEQWIGERPNLGTPRGPARPLFLP